MSNFSLFLKLFVINSFTFGGGYTIIPIIEQTFVNELKLIEKQDMQNIISLANTVPGAMAISTSFLLGYKIKGIKGAIIATLASVLPCILIIAIIYNVYSSFITNPYIKAAMDGIGVAVSAILLATVAKMFINIYKKDKKYLFYAICILSFILSYFFNFKTITILIIAAVLGVM